MHDDPRLGAVGLDTNRTGDHAAGGEATPKDRKVVEAVQLRQDQRRLGRDPLEGRLEPDALRGDDQRVGRLIQARHGERPADEVPEGDARDLDPPLGDQGGRGLGGHDRHLVARALEDASEQSADAAGTEHGDPHRGGLQEYTGVHDPGRVEACLGGPQGAREQLRSLAFIPGPVIAADGMVVGDRRRRPRSGRRRRPA